MRLSEDFSYRFETIDKLIEIVYEIFDFLMLIYHVHIDLKTQFMKLLEKSSRSIMHKQP